MKLGKIQIRDSEKFEVKTRIYMSPTESILEQFANRRCRPVSEYRNLLPAIFKKAKIPLGTKARWSQKAGCNCGCSPGFIVDYFGKDIFANVVN